MQWVLDRLELCLFLGLLVIGLTTLAVLDLRDPD